MTVVATFETAEATAFLTFKSLFYLRLQPSGHLMVPVVVVAAAVGMVVGECDCSEHLNDLVLQGTTLLWASWSHRSPRAPGPGPSPRSTAPPSSPPGR